jgi:AraC-type DNA-binding domain-containing proteins
MELLYSNEHFNCYNYDKGKNSPLEVVEVVKGKTENRYMTESEIVFFMEGRIKYTFEDFPEYEGMKGRFLFIPSGSKYSQIAIANSILIVFRLKNPLQLCDFFHIEKLYKKNKALNNFQPGTISRFSVLDINARLWPFLSGISDCLSDGIRCRYYYDLKIKELLLYLRIYYRKEELHDFFCLILSNNTAFSEYIRLSWHRFKTIHEMAESMCLTHKQFFMRFVSVFEKKPRDWINEARAEKIYKDIVFSKEQFKQIAAKNGFSHEALFTRFCKNKLGATPTELRKGRKGQENDKKR